MQEQKINKRPCVAVIVPIYNVEQYVRACVESLIQQSLDNILIICVDDGSTDKSCEIVEQYKRSDTRIHMITQEHQGQGIARNTGINYALQFNPEYIGFVDSDDFVDSTMYEKLYTQAQHTQSDIAYCNILLYNDSTKEKQHWVSLTPPPITHSLQKSVIRISSN